MLPGDLALCNLCDDLILCNVCDEFICTCRKPLVDRTDPQANDEPEL